MSKPNFAADRDESIVWARDLLARPERWVVLDTETTGVDTGRAEVVQIAVLAPDGKVLIDTLVKPGVPIETGAWRVHRLTAEKLRDAPTFAEVWRQVAAAIAGRYIMIYNRDFDLPILRRQAGQAGHVWLWTATRCAMLEYAAFCGEWDDRRGSYRWQRLPSGDHSAAGDCRAVLKLVYEMAAATLTIEQAARGAAATVAWAALVTNPETRLSQLIAHAEALGLELKVALVQPYKEDVP